jgi:hypothetical protein
MHGDEALLLIDKLVQPCHAGFELLFWVLLVKLLWMRIEKKNVLHQLVSSTCAIIPSTDFLRSESFVFLQMPQLLCAFFATGVFFLTKEGEIVN